MTRGIRRVVNTLMFAAAGALAGLGAGSALAPSPLLAAEQAVCENDECERVCDFFSCHRHCIDNAGGNTACAVTGSDCATQAC
jgi:hypothetical protein